MRRNEASEREPLSPQRVIRAAVELADEKGAPGVTMRAVAARLDVKAMSLYNHVADRDALMDGMIDAVFAEATKPTPRADWREAMRDRTSSLRSALLRHPWAIGLLDSRKKPGPTLLRHHDATLGALREGGFSVTTAARAVSVIDSYLYGFVLQESSLPFNGPEEMNEVAGGVLESSLAEGLPNLAELVRVRSQEVGYDFDREFEYGLTLLLDAIHADRTQPGGSALENGD
ncbi:TetR/AcrR family transcriptional regulator [Nocardiopsis valliformis]|uniref:TetR/AcrR family transcriptional regulator n=1 Tax=Nocardiopsis valliformis TaxID=239974 RepID=UPI001EF9E72C|nr:TetR/AcrR family transcriptional regulator [Nocardiopsis valliformis]